MLSAVLPASLAAAQHTLMLLGEGAIAEAAPAKVGAVVSPQLAGSVQERRAPLCTQAPSKERSAGARYGGPSNGMRCPHTLPAVLVLSMLPAQSHASTSSRSAPPASAPP